MYYRKGPWFRIDDIYSKYYSPHGKGRPYPLRQPSQQAQVQQEPPTPSSSTTHPATVHDDTNHTTCTNTTTNIPHTHGDEWFESVWLQPFRHMIQDLYDLYRAGYIRMFHTEMECGQTIGGGSSSSTYSHSSYSSSLLTVEEQQWILSKLGGGTKTNHHHTKNRNHQRHSQQHSTTTNTPTTTKGTHAHPLPVSRPNRIWQQMRQQTSIRTSFAASSSSSKMNTTQHHHRNVLPVRNHVETLLLQKLVQVLYSSTTTHSEPTHNIHSNGKDRTTSRVSLDHKSLEHAAKLPSRQFIFNVIQQYIQNLFRTGGIDGADPNDNDVKMYPPSNDKTVFIGCIRLCELPLLTLRRCVRLYLCATSGPGVMRSTPNNGYRSCNSRASSCCDTESPLACPKSSTNNTDSSTRTSISIMEPLQNWHLVQYPSMTYCFGFTSAPYYNAYQPLLFTNNDSMILNCTNNSVAPHPNHGFPPEQVFPTYLDFLRWEAYVEIRCYVDDLLEWNDRYRSEERKRHRAAPTPELHHESSLEPGCSSGIIKAPSTAPGNISPTKSVIDCMSLLTANGRNKLLEHFVTQPNRSLLCGQIELAVADARLTKLVGDYEQILGVIGIIIIHILSYHFNQHQSNSNESASMISLQGRPWLRHMSWLAGFALIVFDIMYVRMAWL